MSCERIAGHLAAGEDLDPSMRAHVEGCERCAASARVVARWSPPDAFASAAPIPNPATLRTRSRRPWMIAGAAAIAATVLFSAGVGNRAPPRPEPDLFGALDGYHAAVDASSPGFEMLDLFASDSDPLDDPSQLLTVALLGKGNP